MQDKRFELIIRPKASIKPRKWWLQQIKRFFKIVPQFLSNKQFSLYKNLSITLLITKNKEIQLLNKKFRNINKPTDVLSFQLSKTNQINYKHLGDIAISEQYVKDTIKYSGQSLEDELQMLLIHGYLHLLGYDHMVSRDARIMFPLQNKILNKMTKNHVSTYRLLAHNSLRKLCKVHSE